MDMTRDLTDIPMSVFSRVSTSRNKSSFVGGYLRHGERFAAWFTGQSWWMRSRTMSGDRTEERKSERETERKNKSEGGRKIEGERPGKTEKRDNQRRERERKKEREKKRRDLLLGSGRGGRERGTTMYTERRGKRGECRAVLIEV